jgi:hypothetical protein
MKSKRRKKRLSREKRRRGFEIRSRRSRSGRRRKESRTKAIRT